MRDLGLRLSCGRTGVDELNSSGTVFFSFSTVPEHYDAVSPRACSAAASADYSLRSTRVPR